MKRLKQEKNTETLRLRHEWKNQLLSLRMLQEKGDQEGLSARLRELDDELDRLTPRLYTDHLAVNTILQKAAAQADRQGIAFACQVQVPRELSIDEADLCTLLVNLLDNALEACERIPERERFLRVYLAVNGRQLYMSIQNSAKEELNFNERNYITQKRGSHGFGMKRVSAVVEKYDGFLNLANEPGIFAAEVTLPLAG